MFTENLDIFFSDFGVPVTFGALNVTGILDMPGDVVLGNIISDDYALNFKTADLPGLKNASALLITHPAFGTQATAFTVRDVRAQGDGALSIAYLSRT